MKRHTFMDRMTEISSDQAEKIYNELMNGPSPHLFAKINNGKVPVNSLSETEIARIYKEYANENLEVITEQEVNYGQK